VPRVTRGTKRRQRRKKILAKAKGFFQAKSKLYRYAKEAVDRSEKFAYIGRKLKKRDFRSLWITRISAGTRSHGLSYSRFMNGLKTAGIDINRKMLSEMAIRDPDSFQQLVAASQTALGLPVTAPAAKPAAEPKPAKAKAKDKKPADEKPAAKAKSEAPEPAAKAEASAADEKPAGDAPASEEKPESASKPSDE
jgi:large subunit ribosomal protein L20